MILLWFNTATSTDVWIRVNAAKPDYDESEFTFDDSTLFYDGFDASAWTKISKPNN